MIKANSEATYFFYITKYIDEWADWGYIRYNEEELKEEKKRLQEKIKRYHILRERRIKRDIESFNEERTTDLINSRGIE